MVGSSLKLLAAIPLLLAPVAQAAVMSVDLGTDWLKCGLVKPSIPFDIILNRDSKRKTQKVIAIRGTERTFGVNGQALAMRYPKDVYSRFRDHLGKKKSVIDEQLSSSVWNRMEQCEDRETLIFTADDGAKYSVEELSAMMLQYANEEGKTAAEESIKDTVLTTPAFSNQFERQALLDSGEIAEINVLTLINDGSAVALNYAMTRKFSAEPHTHVIYDMGSGNTVATLVTFREVTVKEGKYRRNVTYTQVEVLGVGYDKTLGGNAFDDRVKDLLLEKFAAKNPSHKESIHQSPRSILKLQKEATRVKQVLSANNDAYSSIESLYDDIDFKASIARTAFEESSADLFDRVLGPIKDALTKGKLQISNVDSIILFGGGVRIPKIQAILKEFAGADKISQNVNGDEAAALGAVFRGAGMSSQFKVKDIRLKERVMYPFELVVAPESEDLDSGKRHTLFEANAPLVESFFLPLKLNSDFNFRLQYGEASDDAVSGTGCRVLAEGQVRGLAKVLEQHKERLLEEPKLRVLVSMTPSGIVSIVRAQAVLQLKPIVVPDANATAEAKNETAPEATKKVTEKVNLEMTLSHPCLKPLSKADKLKSMQKLRVLANLDKERFDRDEARNKLESFVYSTPEYLEKEEVVGVTTEDERAALTAAVEQASEWLSDSADAAAKKELDDKLIGLEKLKNPIVIRLREAQKRPAALEALRSSLDGIELYHTTMTNNLTAENKAILAPTIEKINVAVKKTTEWLKTNLDAQEKLLPHDNPVIFVKDIETKQKELDSLKFRLIREIIALPPPPKPEAKEDPKEKSEDKPSDNAEEAPKDEAEANTSDEQDEL